MLVPAQQPKKTNVLYYWYCNYEIKNFLYLIVFQSISVINVFSIQNAFIYSVIISVLCFI